MKKTNFLFFALFLCVLSCKSIKQPESIALPLDYTKEDVINNEKSNIIRLQQTDSVKALFRAYFLQDKQTLDSCINLVTLQMQEAINDKDYYLAQTYLTSLEAVGCNNLKEYSSSIQKLLFKDLPTSQVPKNKLPKTIQDCVNATVTIWVDKGMKVSNGAGYADIVIGSGFFIDNRGYLITNYHVIQDLVDSSYEGYSRLYIKLNTDSETKIPAKVIGYDSIIDLALLKTEISPQIILSLGSSSSLSVGDKISAIGSPIGLEGTLTSGIISSVDRKLTTIGNVFQLDAAVNSGNSGGPIIDQNKKVQAIVFAGMLQFQGLNFAIPVEYLKQELPLLYNGGEILHTWIGAFGHTKKIKGVNNSVEIQYVMPGGSAHFAKLKEGDCIIQIEDFNIKTLEDLQLAFLTYLPNTIVRCKYKEAETGIIKNTVLLLEKRPDSPSIKFYESDLLCESFIPLYGIKMTPSSTTNKKSYTITKIIKGSTADNLGFSEGDPIIIKDIQIDYENKVFYTQIYVKRRSKGFIDMAMVLPCSFDAQNYF